MRSSAPRKWQYSFDKALRIAGPAWRLTSERTTLNKSWGSDTSQRPLPLGLCQSGTLSLLPPLTAELLQQKLLNEMVQPVPGPEGQDLIRNESDVIENLGVYLLNVVRYLVPGYHEALGCKGKIQFPRQVAAGKSRPDCVISYDGRNIISFDYKGPNCVREDDIERCTVTNPDEAKKGILRLGRDESKYSQGHEGQGDTLLRTPGIALDTERLIQTAVKYRDHLATPIVMFYDVNTLTVLEPPPDLEYKNGYLMDIFVWKEPRKSMEGAEVEMQDNHLAILLRYIGRMAMGVDATWR